MRPVDIFAIAAAIVIALLSLIVEPWSGPWWIALLLAAFVALWALLHMLVGGGVRRIIQLTAVVFLAIGGPLFGFWYWWNYPASLKLVQARFPVFYAPPIKSTNPSQVPLRTTTATFGKAYYKCKNKEGELDQAAIEKHSAAFKAYIEPFAQAYDFKPPIITVVPGGDKAELIPIDPQPQNFPTKRTFQIVRIGKELTGIYSADYTITLYANVALTAGTPWEGYIRKVIANLAGVDPDDCELQ